MKKTIVFIIALLILTGGPLAAMVHEALNEAEQIELARREQRTKLASASIQTLAISAASAGALYYLAHFTNSWQNKYVGNAVWFGASSLVALFNTITFFNRSLRTRMAGIHIPDWLDKIFFNYTIFANPIIFNAAKHYLSYQQSKQRGIVFTVDGAAKLGIDALITFFGTTLMFATTYRLYV